MHALRIYVARDESRRLASRGIPFYFIALLSKAFDDAQTETRQENKTLPSAETGRFFN